MKNPICFLILFTLLISSKICAQKYDYQWAFGYSNSEPDKFGISLLDFNKGALEVSFLRESENYDLGIEGSFTNNSVSGILDLHTNNCVIKDNEWNILNSSYIHDEQFDIYCNLGDFPMYQGSILIPDLLQSNLVHYIGKDKIIDFEEEDIYSDNLFHIKIKQSNTNKYTLSQKQKINSKKYTYGDVTATPNNERNAWWLVQAHYQSNEIVMHLINKDTITKSVQTIGVVFTAVEQGIGQTQFSPDGSMLAFNSEIGIHLYDFDNDTGLLSNYRKIEYPNQNNVAQGLCFSPSSRFIYVNNAEEIYQIDLELMDEPHFIPYHSTLDEIGWPVGLGMMLPGPDCRIYMSPGSSTNFLHVIHQPDEKGDDCLFQPRAIELPARIPHHLPNLPNYRYLTGCDSTITFPFPIVDVEDHEEIVADQIYTYPNPAQDIIYIRSTGQKMHSQLYLIDQLSRPVMSIELQHEDQALDISELASGIYFLADASSNILWKVIKM